MKGEGVKMGVNIGPKEIHEGSQKLMLGMLWCDNASILIRVLLVRPPLVHFAFNSLTITAVVGQSSTTSK